MWLVICLKFPCLKCKAVDSLRPHDDEEKFSFMVRGLMMLIEDRLSNLSH